MTLKEFFIQRLTVDSNTEDRRKKEFNQAIFSEETGSSCFNRMELDMVLEKFDLAFKDYNKEIGG